MQSCDQLDPAAHADLGEHRLQVVLHGVGGDEKAFGDLRGGPPGQHLATHVALPRRQSVTGEEQSEQPLAARRLDADRYLGF